MNETVVLETERLILRRLTPNDLDDLAALYADPDVMRFYPATRTRAETKQNLDTLIAMYAERGYGLYATVHKADGRFIGRCGLMIQTVHGKEELEVGYMLDKAYWRRGLATEAARALRDWGFRAFGAPRIISLIRPENVPSQGVALKNGMHHGADTVHANLAHRVYAIERETWEGRGGTSDHRGETHVDNSRR